LACPDGHPADCKLPSHRQSARCHRPPERRPTEGDHTSGQASDGNHPDRKPGQGQPTKGQTAEADWTDSDPTHREKPAEGDVANGNPPTSDASAVATVLHLTGGEMDERQTQHPETRLIDHTPGHQPRRIAASAACRCQA
jgi:hypothetical protein